MNSMRMPFGKEEIFAGINKAANHIPIESLSKRLRFGEHRSPVVDKGPDFYQIRDYDPEKDSVVDIIWPLRTSDGKVFVRDAKITKEFVVVILADLSASMAFSTGYPYKARMLLETVGNLGETCFHGQDPMGLIGFSEDIIFDELPRVGEDYTYFLINRLYDYFESLFAEGRKGLKVHGTDFYKAFDFLLKRHANRRCFVAVVSDFIGVEELAESDLLKDIASQHEVVFIFLDDPSEFRFGRLGYVRMADIETGKTRVVSSRQFSKIASQIRAQRKVLREALRDVDVDSIVLEYGKHFERLDRFFLMRQELLRI